MIYVVRVSWTESDGQDDAPEPEFPRPFEQKVMLPDFLGSD